MVQGTGIWRCKETWFHCNSDGQWDQHIVMDISLLQSLHKPLLGTPVALSFMEKEERQKVPKWCLGSLGAPPATLGHLERLGASKIN